MREVRRFLVITAGLLWSAPMFAATISEKPDSVMVTIYHEGDVDTAELIAGGGEARREGLAFITERRTIDLPAGPATIEFRGVAATIVPQTAEIHGLPGETAERNFDYDLLSPGSLVQKSVGATVTLIRTDRKTGKESAQKAILRTGPDGAVLDIGGKIEALGCSGAAERLVFEQVPSGLRDTPTLSLRLRDATAGRYIITLNYIATGMNWSADYVAKIRPGSTRLDLSGWLTVANFGETGFSNTPVEVVAGKLMTTGEDLPVEPDHRYRANSCWPTQIDWATHRPLPLPPPLPPPPAPMMMMDKMRAPAALESVVVTGARREIEAQELGDYKLYALPEATDLWARRTKQVQFLDQQDVPFDPVYVFDGENITGETWQPATVLLRLKNSREGGLGKPLPAGSVLVFGGGDDPQLLGGDKVRDVSVGMPLEIKIGRAMAVQVQSRVTQSKRTGRYGSWTVFVAREVTIINGKKVPLVFELRQSMSTGMTIEAESERHIIKPEGAVWGLELKPGERRTVRYTTLSR